MQNKIKKVWFKRMWIWILCGILFLIVIYLSKQAIKCHFAVAESRTRLAEYGAETAALSYGNMTYIDNKNDGEVILAVHGIFGGYDQGYDACKDFSGDYRIISPSRFGYLNSDVSGGGTPAEQAAAYAELLDKIGVDKVFLLATSAGGAPAIRFALDYPERTKGLILYCSAMPYTEKPEKYAEYAGPPAFLLSDYAMFLMSPFFEVIMGLPPSTIDGMLPVAERKEGVVLDASVVNPDMARNFDDYNIESLQVPTLIVHAKDDKLADYSQVEKAVVRFPNCTLVAFETGGHLMTGNVEAIYKAVTEFINNNYGE